MTLDEGLSLEDSGVSPDKAKKAKAADDAGDDVLGSSGSGSDVISAATAASRWLTRPTAAFRWKSRWTSGGGADESLELGEDDMLTSARGRRIAHGLKTDEEFLLTPLEESTEEESESGSQVIALDTEPAGGLTPATAGSASGVSAMLDEDFGSGGLGSAASAGDGTLGGGTFGEGLAAGSAAAVLPEALFSADRGGAWCFAS